MEIAAAAHVDLPVPRGPNRKKLPVGERKNRPTTAILLPKWSFHRYVTRPFSAVVTGAALFRVSHSLYRTRNRAG